jgi:hypothetical protein
MHIKLQPENLQEREYLGDVDVDGKTMLKWILKI